MLVWSQPTSNEVNFLPWFVHSMAHKRRKRLWLYSVLVVFIALCIAWFGVVYTHLLQAQVSLQQQLSASTTHLQKQQRIVWAGSLEERQKQWRQTIDEQRRFNAWLPAMQLSKLLGQLHSHSHTQLVSWQWQAKSDERLDTHSVLFIITGQEPWQAWWQQALKVWPSIRMETLEPKGKGWALKASYIVQADTKVEPKPEIQLSSAPLTRAVEQSPAFTLQLTLPNITDATDGTNTDLQGEPFADMAKQLQKYGQALNISRSQGVQASAVLPSAAWVLLAPLPSAQGFWLQGLSIEQTPSDQWQVSMQWVPSNDAPPLTFAPSANALTTQSIQSIELSAHQGILYYAKKIEQAYLATQKPLSKKSVPFSIKNHRQAIKQLEFIGYSTQQKNISEVWLKSLMTGRLIKAQVGSMIYGWRVSDIGPQGVSFTLGQQHIKLPPACFTGVFE